MKNPKLIRILATLTALMMILAACGDGDDAADDTTGDTADSGDTGGDVGSIWVLLPDSASSARWETDDRRFFEAAFEAAGLTEGASDGFTIVNAEGDANTQQAQAEQAINEGASVILIVNLDSASAATIIDQAREADVKVVDYDRLTIEGDGADVYVSFDNVRVGATMAEVLEPAIDDLGLDNPQVVLLNGGPTDNNATLFREGYGSVADARADAGDWTIAAEQAVPDWDNQQALTIFESILADLGQNVDAVFAANDGLAGAVVAALQTAGADPVPLSGQDATAAGIQNILLGWQTMTVYKPIKAEAEAAAAAALALQQGEDVTALTGDFEVTTINNGTNDLPFIALTPIAVTADNVAETVIADGFRTVEEICTGEVETTDFCTSQG
jgi:D-xylose transport system substrate-binding protein